MVSHHHDHRPVENPAPLDRVQQAADLPVHVLHLRVVDPPESDAQIAGGARRHAKALPERLGRKHVGIVRIEVVDPNQKGLLPPVQPG